MLEAVELRDDRTLPLLVLKTEQIHGDPAAEVDVFPPVRSGHKRAVSLCDLEREAAVGLGQIAGIRFKSCHGKSSGSAGCRQEHYTPLGAIGQA